MSRAAGDGVGPRVVRDPADLGCPAAGCVLAIGNFDGVHLGHQALLGRAATLARARGAHAVALTFEPHPVEILAPERAPPRLTPADEKVARLGIAGADAVVVLASRAELLRLTAEEFLEAYVARCRPCALIEGPTFRFGRDRGGGRETLMAFAAERGLAFEVLGEIEVAAPSGRRPVNSTAIRSAIREGRLPDAAAMLGRPYRLCGMVGSGAARGAKLGFPTANLDGIGTLLPELGVYAAVAERRGGELHLAAVNIGPQPTFAGAGVRVEAHLLDFDGDLRGQVLGLHLLDRLRGQQKFAGVEELSAQLRADVAAVRGHAGAEQGVARRPRVALTVAPPSVNG